MSNTPEQTAPDAADGSPPKSRLTLLVFLIGVASVVGFGAAVVGASQASAVVGRLSGPLAAAGFVLGVIAQNRMKHGPPRSRSRMLATAGVLACSLTIGLTLMTLIACPNTFRWTRELAWRRDAAVNAERVWRAADEYARQHDGAFPPVLDMLVDQELLADLTLDCGGAADAVCDFYYVAGLRRSDAAHWILAYTDACTHGGRHVVFVGGGVEFVAESELEGRLQAFIDEYKATRGVRPVIIPPH